MRADTARGEATQTRDRQDRLLDHVVADGAGLVRVDIERQRLGYADGISDLDGAARGKASGHHVLGEVSGDVGGRAVNLGRVLAAERAAAMRGCAAISVDDDLAARDPCIAIRPTDLERAGGVNVIDRIAQQHRGYHFGNDALYIGFKLGIFGRIGVITREAITLFVLSRDHHRGRGDWERFLVAQRHLTLGIWFKERGRAGMAIGRHPLQDFVAVIQRRGHQVGGFVGGIAEHDPLIARTFILVVARVDPLRDFRRLAMQVIFEAQSFPVEAVLRVTDFLNGAADGGLDFCLGTLGPLAIFINALAANFAREHNKLRRGQCFACDARFGVFG